MKKRGGREAASVLRYGFLGQLCQSVGWTDTDKHGRARTSTEEHGRNGEGVWCFARVFEAGDFAKKPRKRQKEVKEKT